MDSGIYIACFYLEKEKKIEVGKLGRFNFKSGFYFYIGSAQKNLSARLNRHRRKEKSLRWHIDYLSFGADMFGALIIPGKKQKECRVAGELGRIFQTPAPGFGSSDCRCDTHLYYSKDFSEFH